MQNDTSSPALPILDDGVFGGINLLNSLLRDLDDRGLILSLAAFAEEALGELLNAYMVPSEATSKLLEGFNAPLGTLSSRIKAAYAMGLITGEQLLDLERLRKVRNEFAHSWKPIDIATPKIASLIDGMNFSHIDVRFPETLNEKLRSSISCLLIELRSSTHEIQKKNMRARLIGAHLIRGFPGDFESQIQNAHVEFGDIVKSLTDSQGKKRHFYLALLNDFDSRLTVVAQPTTAEQKQKVAALYEEVKRARSQYLA